MTINDLIFHVDVVTIFKCGVRTKIFDALHSPVTINVWVFQIWQLQTEMIIYPLRCSFLVLFPNIYRIWCKRNCRIAEIKPCYSLRRGMLTNWPLYDAAQLATSCNAQWLPPIFVLTSRMKSMKFSISLSDAFKRGISNGIALPGTFGWGNFEGIDANFIGMGSLQNILATTRHNRLVSDNKHTHTTNMKADLTTKLVGVTPLLLKSRRAFIFSPWERLLSTSLQLGVFVLVPSV